MVTLNMGRSYDISVFLNPMSYSDSPKRGFDVLRDPRLNKGTAFTRRERQELGIVGLLPDIVSSMEMQMERIEGHVDSLTTDLDRYRVDALVRAVGGLSMKTRACTLRPVRAAATFTVPLAGCKTQLPLPWMAT